MGEIIFGGGGEETLAICDEWYKKESGNVLGTTALIYVRTAAGDFEGANQIVEQYILEDGSYTDDIDGAGLPFH